ncbi:allantoate permease [Aspergillus karnatakaensis]|uniref:allantoate permease n=1 Tax=Aspergillus karnatakaensis TaxID=1810916 RepID=UPI003CCCCC3E
MGDVNYLENVDPTLQKTQPPHEPSWSKEDERQALRRLDWHLIPLLGGLYLCSYMDRGNIGNAYTAGMGKSWSISSSQYSMIVTVYYIAYICFHWLILAWKIVPLPLWAALMAVGWGTMDMIQAATVNYAGLLILRILVGIFEAGFVPAIALYLSFFYHRREMGLRYGLFMSCAPLANGIASAIAYGVVNAENTSLEHWQLIFLIEGAPTIILAVVAYFYLPNGPFECPFLDESQNQIIGQRAVIGRGNDQEKKIDLKQAFAAFNDYKNYLQAAIIFCLNTAFGSLPAYLPTILADMGFSNTQAEGLSAIPYLSACAFCVAISFASDRYQARGIFIAIFALLGGAGYVVLATVSTNAIRFFATFLICAGVFPAVSLTFTWVTDNQGSSSKRGVGLAIFGMIGQCGPLLGARIFPSNEGPIYSKGMWICAGVLFGAAAISLILRWFLSAENIRRDREHGASDPQYAPSDIADLGDAHPMYRFVL